MLDYLASLSDDAFNCIIAESRGADLSVRQLIERELARPTD